MTRHGNNCTNGAVYSYHEKKKDQKAAGFGAERIRMSKDGIKGFDCCSLTLQPTSKPVVTPQGFIFDKVAILEFILDKKKEYEKKMKEYEKQKDGEVEELKDIAAAEKEQMKQRFEETEKSIVTKRLGQSSSKSAGISNMIGERKRELPSFWLPSCGPQAKKSRVEKPDKIVYCPISRKPIKMKDLLDVKWIVARDPDDKRSLISREERYQCAVTGDVLNNATPCVVLKQTGHVVTVDCVNKIIKKDWRHPLTGQSMTEKDIIYIKRGSTGFSSVNEELMSERHRPSMAIA